MKIRSILFMGLALLVPVEAGIRRRRTERGTNLADISEEILESGRNRIRERYLKHKKGRVEDEPNKSKSSKADVATVTVDSATRETPYEMSMSMSMPSEERDAVFSMSMSMSMEM